MSERINVDTTSYAARSAIQAGVGAAIASLRYDRAIASQRDSLTTIHDAFLVKARSRVATQNLRIRLGL